MKADEILSQYQALKSRASTRETLYDEIEKACGGLFEDRTLEGSFPKDQPSNLPDRSESERGNAEIVVEKLRPIVSAKRAFLGQLPNVRIPRPPTDGSEVTQVPGTPASPGGSVSDPTQLRVDKQTRVLRGIWRRSQMVDCMSNIGLFCTVYGTAVGIVWPDFDAELPKIIVRAPRGFYPQEKSDNGHELYSAIFYAKRRGAQIASEFGKKQYANVDKVEVLQYFDDKEITTITTDGTILKSIKHKLKFCPVVSIPNIGWGSSPFGDSEVASALKLIKYINYGYALQLTLMDFLLQQPLVLPPGAEKSWPDSIPAGPKDIIELAENGGGAQTPAYRLPPIQIPFDFNRLIQDLHQQVSEVADSPAALQSKWDNSGTVTGAAVTSLLGPVQLRLGHSLSKIHSAVEILNRYCFQMLETMFPGKHTVYGTYQKSKFTEQFDIKEFEGWYENEVFLNPGSFFDQQSQFLMALQGMQNDALSHQTLMIHHPLVTDPSAEWEQIKKERMELAQLAAQANAVAQSALATNAPIAEPASTQYGLQKGSIGALPPAQMPGGELPKGVTQPAQETPITSGNDVMQQFVDMIRSVPKVKGSVYLVGPLLNPDQTAAAAQNPDVAAQAHLDITNPSDKATITNFVRANAPEVHGNISFVTVTGPPPEPYVTVFENGQPGSGYDITGGPSAQDQGQQAPAPSDMAALLGGVGGGAGIPQTPQGG